jgi:type IV pilus assembly protein PilA
MASARLRDEHGFSLIELMVVVMIIAILLAIAIPVFMGMRSRAQDTGAKTSAALALRMAKAALDENDNYANTTPVSMGANEPSLTFVDGATSSTSKTTVSTDVPDIAGSALLHVVAVYSESGKCFFAEDHANGTAVFGVLDPATTADCQAQNTGGVTFNAKW